MGGAIWKGYIRFNGTNTAVKLHPAVREEQVRFHLLHKRDHARLHQQMICAYDHKPVPAEAQVRGFEVEEGRYIIVEQSELEDAAQETGRTPENSRAIEVHEFVGVAQIDPIFLERAYFLEPADKGKEYNALAAAMKETDSAGICTWTMRKRTYSGALYPAGRTIRLYTLRYADEIIEAGSLGLDEMALSEKELSIGVELISRLTAPFKPEEFENEHHRKLRDLIEKKSRGEKIALLRPVRLKPTMPDRLLQTLEASLKKVA